jgi:cytochrome c
MNFFDNLVLPQSSEHIQLIHYLLVLIYFLFIPYIGMLFVTSLMSVIYRNKGLKEGNQEYLGFAYSLVRLPTFNKSVGVILGIIPFITIAFMFSQIMHGTNTFVLDFLFASFLLGAVGVILIYTFRYSQDFEEMYQKIKLRLNNQELDEDIERSSKGSNKLAGRSGIWGVLALAAALWFLFAAATMVRNPSLWTADSIYVLSSWKVMLAFAQFLALSVSITGAALLFFYFYWEGGKENISSELSVKIQKNGMHMIFWGALVLPLIMLADLFSLQVQFLSGTFFTFSLIALILLFLVYNLVYGIFKDKNLKLSGVVFLLILLATMSLIIKDQAAMTNATEQHAVILNARFEEYLAGITGNRGVAEVSGKEIFDVRCSSCHQFDQKLVGPSYKDVLPKYEGKADQLVGYILNPVKVDPQFPPMPNPGLKPNEAKAVADYLLENYKK